MTASIQPVPFSAILPQFRPASDKFTTTDVHNSSLVWIFCELAERSNSCPKLLARLITRWQIPCAVFCELLGCRDVYEFLESVKSYLRWRQLSTRKRFTPYRNQSSEHQDIGHALWILNQAWNTPELPKREALADLDRLLADSPLLRKKYGLTEISKKQPQSCIHSHIDEAAPVSHPSRRRSDFSRNGKDVA